MRALPIARFKRCHCTDKMLKTEMRLSRANETRLPCTTKSALISRMNFFIQRSELRDIYDKVVAGERISEADALRLFESKDLNAIGAIADFARQRKVGNRASYIINRYINYSNYCILSCQFCSFARKKRDADGFQLTTEEIVQKAREALKLGITELHIVGGLHPSLPFSYYTGHVEGAAKAWTTRLQLKCFTAIEILHLAWLAKKSVQQTLIEFKEAGLESLTGGGAEIFRKEVRSAIARGKESAEEYLDVHRTWHKLGGRSTCTMLYGHVENLADRVDHLRQLRDVAGRDTWLCRLCATGLPAGKQRHSRRTLRRPASIHSVTSPSAASTSITSTTSPPIGLGWG